MDHIVKIGLYFIPPRTAEDDRNSYVTELEDVIVNINIF
jgi:hypothetical protein